MNIKHLVLAGGGQNLFNYIGVFDGLFEKDIIKMDNIETIYGTSSGGLIALMLALKYDWCDIKKYIINCTWDTIIDFNMNNVMNIFSKKGVFDETLYVKVFEPLFSGKDLPLDLTLKQLYEYSNIDIHVFTTELNSFEVCDVSHESFPDLLVLEAMRMTSSFPLLISPLCKDDKFYLDGGIVKNYPLDDCIANNNLHDDTDTILGIKNIKSSVPKSNNLNNDSSLIDYILGLIKYVTGKLSTSDKQIKIKNEIEMNCDGLSFESIINCIKYKDKRIQLVEDGYESTDKLTVILNEIL
jgi:NTE family protein